MMKRVQQKILNMTDQSQTAPTRRMMKTKQVKNNRKVLVKEIVIITVCAIALSILGRLLILSPFVVPSSSMEGTLVPGDRILVRMQPLDMVIPGPRYERGSIIVFSDDEHWLSSQPTIDSEYLVKRIIGMPGDRVQGKPDGTLWVNGEKLTEPYVAAPESTTQVFDITVPEDRLWVMGDNRDSSSDSRAHRDVNEGTISEESVIGEVALIFSPWDRIGKIQ